jgi:hypothetical protein
VSLNARLCWSTTENPSAIADVNEGVACCTTEAAGAGGEFNVWSFRFANMLSGACFGSSTGSSPDDGSFHDMAGFEATLKKSMPEQSYLKGLLIGLGNSKVSFAEGTSMESMSMEFPCAVLVLLEVLLRKVVFVNTVFVGVGTAGRRFQDVEAVQKLLIEGPAWAGLTAEGMFAGAASVGGGSVGLMSMRSMAAEPLSMEGTTGESVSMASTSVETAFAAPNSTEVGSVDGVVSTGAIV